MKNILQRSTTPKGDHMRSVEFINRYQRYKLNALVRIMNEIDSFQIIEIAVDPNVKRDAIIWAIDDVLALETGDELVRQISDNLRRLKNIFEQGQLAYETNVVNF